MARRQSVTAASGTSSPKGCIAAFCAVFSLFGLGFAVIGFVVPALRIPLSHRLRPL